MIREKRNGEKNSLISRSTLSQICAVFVKNLVLIGYGMSMAFPTILIPDLSQRKTDDSLYIGKEETSWMGSITLITVPFGCLVSGIVTQPLGRRRSMQLINIPFCLSWICYYFSYEKWHIFTILFVIGLNSGLMEAPVLTYVAEISQPHLRGMLSSSALVTTAVGVMLQFFLGTFLDWRSISICSAIVPIFSFCLLFLIPETPIWLLSKERYEEARESLAWLRGWVKVEDINQEYEEILQNMNISSDSKGNQLFGPKKISTLDNLKLLLKRNSLIPLLLLSLTCFLSHFCGVSPLIAYAVGIFNGFHAPIGGHFATALMGFVAMLGSIVSVLTVRKLGRRSLTFISLIGTAISFAIVGTYAYLFHITTILKSENSNALIVNSTLRGVLPLSDITKYSWIPCFTLIFGVFTSLLGIKVLPWSLVGEILPNETRSIGSGVMGMIFYLLGFLCNKTYFAMISVLSLAGTFFFYSGVCFIGLIVLFFVLPETEGRSLQEINDHFSGKSELGNKLIKGQKHISVQDEEASEKLYCEVKKSLS